MTQPEKNIRRHGRRPIDPARRLSALVSFSVTDEDRERIYTHCDKIGIVPSVWLRDLTLAAMKNAEVGE